MTDVRQLPEAFLLKMQKLLGRSSGSTWKVLQRGVEARSQGEHAEAFPEGTG